MTYRQFSRILLVLFTVALVGCPSPQGAGEGEQDEASMAMDAVVTFPDLARSPETFETAWTSGNVPDEKTRQEYQKFYQSPDLLIEPQEPRIEGNTATVDMTISNLDDPDTVLETVTWTVAKEGETWKLQDAPLPTNVDY
jgi:hypothetical protein